MTVGGPLLLLLLAGQMFLSDEPRPAAVQVGAGADGDLVIGPGGTPLYTYDGVDRGDYCNHSPCRESWPILTAPDDAKPVGAWSVIASAQGAKKVWLYKGTPVYSYAADKGARAATGDGLGGQWHAIRYVGPTPAVPVPASVKVSKVGSAFFLTDYRGQMLYTFARDGKSPACKAECMEVWPPVLAPALARPIGDWTTVDRPDGVRQWAFRGRLVYTFSEDNVALEAKGTDAGGIWKTIAVTERDAAPTGKTGG